MEISELYNLYLKCGQQLTTDSRNCPKGSIFLALKGASFDGNKFAASALEKGCAYAVVDEKEYATKGDERYILVEDTLITYKELAREHRRHFSFPVIGITGTNGKTTTKELISAVLAKKYNVVHTEANYNNDVGVPRTLLTFRPEHEIAVVEMGASHPGDIKKLVEYVEPTCGLITNVGRAHLQGFGSFEGVKRTKGELYDYLAAHDALLFLNSGDADLLGMAQERDFKGIVSYASKDCDEDAVVTGEVKSCTPFLNFTWQSGLHTPSATQEYEVDTHLIGAYNINNLLAAIAVGLYFDVEPELICEALREYEPSNNRSQLTVTQDNKLVVDAYNANPTSMKAALDNFQLIDADHKMVIIGDMLELGEASAAEHQRVVDQLKKMNLEQVWLVGDEFEKTDCNFRKFHNVEEVKSAIAAAKPQGYYILIKGSNGSKLWQLPEKL
ncbi:MAG: UDP-N-acetylmuramoyl-tripeptide--D-alanyl-D-alanine ligase [Prevotella sp.]|jgi:UDP-N-acetylmuramoyl-tripeptide--D-alanyl-D-alanine ligase